MNKTPKQYIRSWAREATHSIARGPLIASLLWVRKTRCMLADEALNFKYFPAQEVPDHINDNIKQDQVHSARMLLLEPSRIYATISLS